jgi:TolC family type I secretion outer membrane protein
MQGTGNEAIGATLSLDEAIAIALKHNPQVGAAEQGVAVVQGQFTQALSLLMPRFEVTSTRSTPVNLPPFSFQSAETTWNTDFSYSQPLYTGGSVQKGVRAARSYLKGASGAYRRTQQEIAFAARQIYYQVLTAEEQVNVSQQVVDSAKEHLRIAGLRYDAGVAPQFDVLAAEARVAQVEQALIAAQANLNISSAALGTVLGVPLPEGVKLSTPRPLEVTKADPEALSAEALEKRPDLLTAKASAAAAWAQLGVAKAARQPTISAVASYSLRPKTVISGDVFGQPGVDFVVSQNSGIIALVASWSLFNGGQVAGQILTAEGQLGQAQKNVETAQLQVALDVKSAYLLLEAGKAQVSAAHKEVEQATEAHRIATLRYQEGVGTSVEILDAEATLQGARTRLNAAIYDLNLALAKLDLAVGRDWAPSEPPQPSSEAAG